MAHAAAVPHRNQNLDLLRATAIAMVLVYHVILMSPVELADLMRRSAYGQYGVDLFFALSGWLIGTLYWKERSRTGGVALWHFWQRRWIRTIPPYLAALTLAWLAAFGGRREPLDWGYLAFVQNYYRHPPFFQVSWSLCIEEHFYLFLPLLIAGAVRSRRMVHVVFLLLIVMAPLGRLIITADGTVPLPGAGFARSATHLRMEGLLLGFWAAYLPHFEPAVWAFFTRRPRVLLGAAVVLIGAYPMLSWLWQYRIGLTMLAVGWVALLMALVPRRPGALAASPVVHAVAVSSYSLYLIHPVMLHVAVTMVQRLQWPWVSYFPVAVGLVAATGAVFYVAVERTSIQWRERWVPRVPRAAAAAITSISL
jgi:peptidoglycan/LPS O-acetylase OafA/YrhL